MALLKLIYLNLEMTLLKLILWGLKSGNGIVETDLFKSGNGLVETDFI